MLSHQCASPPGSHLVPEGLVKAKATRASDRWSSRGVGTLDVVADQFLLAARRFALSCSRPWVGLAMLPKLRTAQRSPMV